MQVQQDARGVQGGYQMPEDDVEQGQEKKDEDNFLARPYCSKFKDKLNAQKLYVEPVWNLHKRAMRQANKQETGLYLPCIYIKRKCTKSVT